MSGPGAVNAHTHLYSGLVPFGMPQPEPPPRSFLEILERVWWRLDRAHDARTLRAAARHYVACALRHGTTALVDHHESPNFIEGSLDVLADACQELGMRAVLCYGATERNGGAEEARRGLDECRRFLRENRRPLVRGVVGLHASFTVSDGTCRAAARLCAELGAVLHVHVAEDAADVADARARGCPGPLQRLLALGALPPGSILAHGVHLTPDEVRHAADNGLWLVHCPRSNRANGVGYAASLAASARVALGTDGFPSDMRAEAGALRALAREREGDPAAAERRLAAGRALLAERFGPGALDDHVTYGPQADEGPVLHASVAGRDVVRDGRLVSGDMDAIEADAREAAALSWTRMKAL